DAPAVIITNDDITTRALIWQYARRMTTGQRLAEITQAFCTDALSSTVNLNAGLDITLCVLAQALLAAFRARLGTGYASAAPDTLPAPLPRHPPARPSSPSASAGALPPPACARPAFPPTPPSPGGTTASSTSNSPDHQGSNPLRGNR